ncbi:hypothetical protein [Aerosakkonema funiforme]|uniref:hypothetical protein n=1 Tax=Aerosakkonema funiforme TaxID=1246630 RepID=UPI0035BB28A6
MKTVQLKLKSVQSAAEKARLTNVPGASKVPTIATTKLTTPKAKKRIRRIIYLTKLIDNERLFTAHDFEQKPN